MLAELPIEKVDVNDLETLMIRWRSSELDLRKVCCFFFFCFPPRVLIRHKIYLVHAMPEDYLVRVDGGQYDRTHYYQSPQSYMSVFGERVSLFFFTFSNLG